MNFAKRAEETESAIIKDRHFLHEHAELSFEEKETTAYLVSELEKMGIPVQTFPDYTGCIATIKGKKGDGPTILLRADIDALPIMEESGVDFASRTPGVMHACGHDAHTSILLAAAEWVVRNKEHLLGKYKFIFQPAEEGVRGGLAVANGGILDDVDEILCFHVGSECKLGEVGICEGGYLATTKLNVSFEGAPAHAGSNPEAGKSALLAACNAATLIAGIPRHSGGLTRVCVGKLEAGESRNVIPIIINKLTNCPCTS